jgi:hypothetical protein
LETRPVAAAQAALVVYEAAQDALPWLAPDALYTTPPQQPLEAKVVPPDVFTHILTDIVFRLMVPVSQL